MIYAVFSRCSDLFRRGGEFLNVATPQTFEALFFSVVTARNNHLHTTARTRRPFCSDTVFLRRHDRSLFTDIQAAMSLKVALEHCVKFARVCLASHNAPMLAQGCSPKEYRAGLDLAIARGWPVLHESGTYVMFTQVGSDLFA